MEIGPVATEFEQEEISVTQNKCKRYYQQFDAADSASASAGIVGVGASTTVAVCASTFVPEMRAAPTFAENNAVLNHGGGAVAITSFSNFSSRRTFGADLTCSGGGLSADGAVVVQFTGGQTAASQVTFDAEL